MNSRSKKGILLDLRASSLVTQAREQLKYRHDLDRLLQEDSECGAPTESVTAESSPDEIPSDTPSQNPNELNTKREKTKARRQIRSKLAKISFTRNTTAYKAGRRFAAEDSRIADHADNWFFQQSPVLQRLNARKLGRSFKRGISTYIRECQSCNLSADNVSQTTVSNTGDDQRKRES